MIIAIDGPAGSGKSTTAKRVAERLGYLHVDTGAMYRAITLKAIRSRIDLNDPAQIAKMLASTRVELRPAENAVTVLLDDENVTDAIRGVDVTRAVSEVSALPAVRQAMVQEQRRMAEHGSLVLDGRDIGTVVFPDADLKVYMSAGIEQRAERRRQELLALGIDTPAEVLQKELRTRDHLDSTRSESPLRKAEGALEIDTSRLTIDEQVGAIVRAVEAVLKAGEKR